MPATLPLELQQHIIDLVLLGYDWSERHVLRASVANAAYARAFLAKCCLISKDWHYYAHKRLYHIILLTSAVKRSANELPYLASFAKQLVVDSRVLVGEGGARSPVDYFLYTSISFSALESLVIRDESNVTVGLKAIYSWHVSYTLLTQLTLVGSTTSGLNCLMATLPNLTIVRSASPRYGKRWYGEPSGAPFATCKLQELVLHTAVELNFMYGERLLQSSKVSLQVVTLAYSGNILHNLWDLIQSVTRLNLALGIDDIEGRGLSLDGLDAALSELRNLQSVSNVLIDPQMCRTSSYVMGMLAGACVRV